MLGPMFYFILDNYLSSCLPVKVIIGLSAKRERNVTNKRSIVPYLLVGMIIFLNFGLADNILLPLITFAIVVILIFLMHTYKEHVWVQKISDLF